MELEMELLREKMEGLSKVQLQLPRDLTLLPFSTRQQPSQDVMPLEENKCSGHCKAIQVRGEKEELQASRDF
ncbi:hypothetical protein RDI58_010876 [Solanum bulbocastanum]|uniref:Uncharacterized protein n=1 Tax=Solanum bulbocastanum TaxID=147425 RepID=A0AAN8TQ37_SOLBU